MQTPRHISLGLFSLSLILGLAACADDATVAADDDTGTETGDGDGDPATGDGDGAPGDGDGAPGDGDGAPGDGDGAPGDGDGAPGDGDGDGAPGDDANLRVLHLGTDAPAVDIYVNGDELPAIEDLAFTDGTGYIPLPPATYTVDIAPADTTLADSVYQIDVDLAANTDYSAVANGLLGDASFNVAALIDDSADIDPANIRLRVTHFAPGVPTVDIYNVADNSLLLENVDYAGTAILDVPSGAYRLGFDVNDDAVYDLTFSVPDLGAGALVNVYAANEVNGKVFLLAHLPDGSTARVDADPKLRALHLGVGAPAVDVFVNDDPTPVVTNLAFTEGTIYLDVPPGAYKLDVAPTGDPIDNAINLAVDLPLEAGNKYTAAAIDVLANLTGLALVDDDLGIAPDQIRFQVVHAAPDVPQVDIWELGSNTMLLENVDFAASAVLDVPVGAYNLGFDVDDDQVPDVAFSVPELPGGILVNVYAANEDGGAPVFLLAQLPDGSTVRIDANPCLLGSAFFDDRDAFLAASGNVVDEDFENSLVAAGQAAVCGTVSSAASACYAAGEIVEGVVFNTFATANQVVVLGENFPNVNNPTTVIGPNNSALGFNATFADPTTRAGFDLWSLTPGNVTVRAFGAGDVELATTNVAANPQTPVFVGVCTSEPIERIEVINPNTAFELVDDFVFGN